MTLDLRAHLQSTLGDAYTLERELGGGGMSRVYVAEDVALRRRIVVKVLPPEMAAEVSVARFQREIALAARLQHPHIVPLLASGETQGLPYYTMPFVDGESLRQRLARVGELPVVEATRLLREITTALAYAHDKGIVHRGRQLRAYAGKAQAGSAAGLAVADTMLRGSTDSSGIVLVRIRSGVQEFRAHGDAATATRLLEMARAWIAAHPGCAAAPTGEPRGTADAHLALSSRARFAVRLRGVPDTRSSATVVAPCPALASG